MLGEMNVIIRPAGWTIPDEAAKIHGITTERATAEGIDLAAAFTAFEFMLKQASLIVAHNAEFDLGVLRVEYLRMGMVPPIEGKPVICTMLAAVPVCRLPGRFGYKWPTLQEAHTHIVGRSFAGAHDALVDVRACRDVYFGLVERGALSVSEGEAPSGRAGGLR